MLIQKQEKNTKKLIQNILLGSFFLFIIFFGLYGSRNIIFGIQIKNVNIKNGLVSENEVLEISGLAKNANKITLNGREITRDKNGYFVESLGLIDGYNTIEIKAEDKFKNTDTETYQVVYKPKKDVLVLGESTQILNTQITENSEKDTTTTKEQNQTEITTEINKEENIQSPIQNENPTPPQQNTENSNLQNQNEIQNNYQLNNEDTIQ